jgi:hypothetical protein
MLILILSRKFLIAINNMVVSMLKPKDFPLYSDPLKVKTFQKVWNYDLTKVEASVRTYQPHIDIVRVMPQYRNFLYLAAFTKDKLPVPSKAIDGIWHTALLYTIDYARFCEYISGCFIHHTPIDDPLTSEQIEYRYNKLVTLSTEHFGDMLFDFDPDSICGCSSGCDS